MKTKLLLLVAALSCLIPAARAATVTYNFDTIFSNESTAPAGATPWMVMSTTDTGANQVSLTFSALNLTGVEHVVGWYLNVDPALDLSKLLFTVQSFGGNFILPTVAKGTDAHIADSGGRYDVHIEFSTSNNNAELDRFTDNDSITYTVFYDEVGVFNTSSFSFIASPNEVPQPYGPFITAARVLSTGQDTLGSAWVTVPEPSVTLYSMLAVCLGLGVRRRR